MVKCFSAPSGKVVCPKSKGFKGRKKQFDETNKLKKQITLILLYTGFLFNYLI